MYCNKCGSAIPEDSSFCANCGAPISVSPDLSSAQPNAQPVQTIPIIVSPQSAPVKRTNGVAIAGFVLGIVSVVFCMVPGLGMILGLVGFILSLVGIKNKNGGKKVNGFAIAGTILSFIGMMALILSLGINAYVKKQAAYPSTQTTRSTTESTIDPSVQAVNSYIDEVL